LAGLATAAFTETAFAAGTVDAVFVPVEIGFTFGVDTIGFTETAAFVFGVTLAVLAFAPFGEGLLACALFATGCTLTVAGAAGFCTAVGVCANAAADRSMSVPRVRII
jgi:uncharacterized membrane protein